MPNEPEKTERVRTQKEPGHEEELSGTPGGTLLASSIGREIDHRDSHSLLLAPGVLILVTRRTLEQTPRIVS